MDRRVFVWIAVALVAIAVLYAVFPGVVPHKQGTLVLVRVEDRPAYNLSEPIPDTLRRGLEEARDSGRAEVTYWSYESIRGARAAVDHSNTRDEYECHIRHDGSVFKYDFVRRAHMSDCWPPGGPGAASAG